MQEDVGAIWCKGYGADVVDVGDVEDVLVHLLGAGCSQKKPWCIGDAS